MGRFFFIGELSTFTTSGFSAAGPQSYNIFAVCFFGEKIPPSRQYNFYLKINLDLNDRNLTKKKKKKKEIGKEMALWEVT